MKLRQLLRENFLSFNRMAIIGGMVRDLGWAGKCCFRSDVDLVIDAPVDEVEALAMRLGARPNRFGGYCYMTGHWKIDFWALLSTWAYREGHTKITQLEDVVSSTFFDWDAILYDVKLRRIICNADYLDNLKARKIEINLLPNPSINGNLLRAVRRIILLDLEPGPLLHHFIMRHLNEASFKEIAAVDDKLYSHSSLMSRFDSADTLRQYINNRERRRELSTYYAKQLLLPGLQQSNR